MTTPGTPPIDRAFVDSNQLVERYLDNKLPYKGQRDLENWCRANPEYLNERRLSERTVTSLKLLEASGMPQDLAEPRVAWWKLPQVLAAACAIALVALVACAVLAGKLTLVSGRLEDARRQVGQGSLAPPNEMHSLRIQPDRAAGIGNAKIRVDHAIPQLIDVGIDMSYSAEKRFRITIDKRDQARALILGAVSKDSNGELHVSFNTTALGSGQYDVSIQALPLIGTAVDAGWLSLEVR
jgi:hypothetical protein